MSEQITLNDPTALPRRTLELARRLRAVLEPGDIGKFRQALTLNAGEEGFGRNAFGFPRDAMAVETALTLCRYVAPDRTMSAAVLLEAPVQTGRVSVDDVRRLWGDDVAETVQRLIKVSSLYGRHNIGENEDANFRRLLLAFAEDIRVIIITIAARLTLMKAINHHPDTDLVTTISNESGYLYAPLAHRLGLYAMKSELEDMTLKYTDRDTYTSIARQLNETKVKRDAYIAAFIAPVRRRLEAMGLKFEIKGRTKSIYSIWNKIKAQKTDVGHIYDLFAIRIILDTAPTRDQEKTDCWVAYSAITDMYRPNPARMKDWVSIPKSNGYESLHITVYGPEDKWVEVQIRTRRMDEVAEKGLAAHWKYKGGASEQGLDAWMRNVRDILETADAGPSELMKNMKLDVYNKEVFIFTPKGDLYRLPLGASVLDLAFAIHSGLGCKCMGARVNGRNAKLNHKLHSGDTVEILTSSTQVPKRDWLSMVVTGKARSKIRATLKEQEHRAAELGKELLQRRFKNRKIEPDEAVMGRLIKKMGYKTASDFYNRLADNTLDISTVLDAYVAMTEKENETAPTVSADEFRLLQNTENEGEGERGGARSEVLEIGGPGNKVRGLNYKLSKCCNPIHGDKVFGFISSEGVVKVHRCDCPNAANIRQRYPDRIIDTRWSGSFDGQMAATLRILGYDDIGIVTNFTSIISKERNASLRSISIDSHDGLFQGFVVVGISGKEALNSLIKKIKTVKGVKDVTRVDSAG